MYYNSNIRTLTIIFLGCAMLILGCTKGYENADIKIIDATYQVESINDCNLDDGGSNGSSIDVIIQLDGFKVDSIFGLQSLSSFDDEPSFYRNLIVNEINGTIAIEYCIRFAQESSVTYELTIITIDGKASNTYTLEIPRPSGANMEIKPTETGHTFGPKQKRIL